MNDRYKPAWERLTSALGKTWMETMDENVRTLDDEDLEIELSIANETHDPERPGTSDLTPQAQQWLRLLIMERDRRRRENQPC